MRGQGPLTRREEVNEHGRAASFDGRLRRVLCGGHVLVVKGFDRMTVREPDDRPSRESVVGTNSTKRKSAHIDLPPLL